MKQTIKKILPFILGAAIFFVILFFLIDMIIMPFYVSSAEIEVPNVIGLHKDKAVDSLKINNLNVIIETPRFNDKFSKDFVVLQKPSAGSVVKKNRLVHLYISGGNTLIKMPMLLNRTLRDAKVTIDRLGFQIGNVVKVESEYPTDMIIEQYPEEGTPLEKGSQITLKVSVGPNLGMVRVPDLLGQSFKEAESILQRNSLFVGKIHYQDSPNLLPNTVIAQFPGKNKLVNLGDSIDVFITRN